MTPPEDDQERILGEILAGELDLRDERAVSFFEKHPELRDELTSVKKVQAYIDRSVDFKRSILADAEQLTDAPGLPEVGRVIHDLADKKNVSREPIRQRIRWFWVGAAATILVGLGWIAFSGDDKVQEGDSVPTGTLLGTDMIKILSPLPGQEEAVEYRFSWKYTGGDRSATYEVVLFEVTKDGKGAEILRSGELMVSDWTPTETQAKRLPSDLFFLVETISATGERKSSAIHRLKGDESLD